MFDIPPTRRLQALDAAFHEVVETLHPQLEQLLACAPFCYADKPRGLKRLSAVYLFTEDNKPFYVGRTRTLGQRLSQHCSRGSQPNQSSVAFKVACETLKLSIKKYQKDSNWKKLFERYEALKPTFEQTKQRMKAMQIRYVAENDDLRQALLEIYCAVALKTPYNEWRTS